MIRWKADRLRRWTSRAGVLAILLQSLVLAGAVPMPADGAVPVDAYDGIWMGVSVCRAGDVEPVAVDRLCPVCFVLCQPMALPPPEIGTIAARGILLPIRPAGDHAASPVAIRRLPARGPPVPV